MGREIQGDGSDGKLEDKDKCTAGGVSDLAKVTGRGKVEEGWMAGWTLDWTLE